MTLEQEDVDPSGSDVCQISILRVEDFLHWNNRSRDKILEEEGINCFTNIRDAYFLIKLKSLNRSKRVRDYVIEKYSEIINFVKDNE